MGQGLDRAARRAESVDEFVEATINEATLDNVARRRRSSPGAAEGGVPVSRVGAVGALNRSVSVVLRRRVGQLGEYGSLRVATAGGMSVGVFRSRLSGATSWTTDELERVCVAIGTSPADVIAEVVAAARAGRIDPPAADGGRS